MRQGLQQSLQEPQDTNIPELSQQLPGSAARLRPHNIPVPAGGTVTGCPPWFGAVWGFGRVGGSGEGLSPLPEAELQEVECQEAAARSVSVCPEPEDAEELSGVAGHQAGDAEPEPAQLPTDKVVDDGTEPWRRAERRS